MDLLLRFGEKKMEIKKGYPYIDYFRILAAVLVIAIHISPLMDINPTADFVLTRIIGRTAVPFFFMITGFFLFENGNPELLTLRRTVWRILKIYVLAIILYLPLTVYNGYFNSLSLFKLIQDIAVNGTLYHLWYLPALITGISVTYLLIKYIGKRNALILSILFYLIGLGGDYYYALIKDFPILKEMYRGIFKYCDYTRNGFFMAPIFLMLGGYLPSVKQYLSKKACLLLTCLSFLLLAKEALLVADIKNIRHDSMYFLLPLVVFFICLFLLKYKGPRSVLSKDVSLLVYVLHPMVIVIVRVISKAIGMEGLLWNPHSVQFIIVTLLSFAISYLGIIFWKGKGQQNG